MHCDFILDSYIDNSRTDLSFITIPRKAYLMPNLFKHYTCRRLFRSGFLVLASTLALLLVPLILSMVRVGFYWSASDFCLAGILIFSFGLCLVLVTALDRRARDKFVCGALVTLAFALLWVDLSVGIWN